MLQREAGRRKRNETAESRRPRPVLWQEPKRGITANVRIGRAIAWLFAPAAAEVASPYFRPADEVHAQASCDDRIRNHHDFDGPLRPGGIAALIADLKRAGWSREEIIATFPWLFPRRFFPVP